MGDPADIGQAPSLAAHPASSHSPDQGVRRPPCIALRRGESGAMLHQTQFKCSTFAQPLIW